MTTINAEKHASAAPPATVAHDQSAIGYLLPEFPGQTHIWMWREIVHLREWGERICLFSTRRPTPDVRARHAFADDAQKETIYLWPQPLFQLLAALVWTAVMRPLGLWRCLRLADTLGSQPEQRRRRLLALIPPACVLARQAAIHRIRHLHVHSCASSAILAMMLKRLNGTPYSLTLNASLDEWGGLMKEKFSDARFTIVITEAMLAQVRHDFPELASDQAILGRIGVDTRKWAPAKTHPEETSSRPFRIITVGRLHRVKGHDVLIRAVHHLVGQGRGVQLDIVGAGPERDRLDELVKQSGLTGQVQIRGSLSEDQIIDLMNQADLFALASLAEPLGVAYMEAMAMGLPTIGTNAGGVPEIITDGQNGLMVPPSDVMALAQGITRLMDDPQLRRRLSLAGRQSIVEKFDSRIGAETLRRRLL